MKYLVHLISLPLANEVWGKIMFLHVCVILFTVEGIGVPACITGHMSRGVCICWSASREGVVCLQGVGQFSPPPPELRKWAVRDLLDSFLVFHLNLQANVD